MVFALAASIPPSAEIGKNTIGATEWFEVAVEANADNARPAAGAFPGLAANTRYPASLVDDLTLAVYEALTNVVDHAYPPEHPHPMMGVAGVAALMSCPCPAWR
jgi:hypothetical protein